MKNKQRVASTGTLLHFTLIELLVVIAVLAVLAGMLLPALGKAKESGKTALCTGNIKSMAQTVTLYASENSDYMPLLVDKNGRVDIMWAQQFIPASALSRSCDYSAVQKSRARSGILTCPSVTDRLYYAKRNGYQYAYYGLNFRAINKYSPNTLKLGQQKKPSRTAMFAENWGGFSSFACDVYEYRRFVTEEDIIRDNGKWNSAVGYRHPRRSANFAYMDGHVVLWKGQDLPEGQYSYDLRNHYSYTWLIRGNTSVDLNNKIRGSRWHDL